MKSSLPTFVILLALVVGLCSAAPNSTEAGNLSSTLDVSKVVNTSLLLTNGTAVENETITLLVATGNDTDGNSTAGQKKDEGNPVLNFLSKSWHALTDFTVGVVGKVMSVVEPDAANNASNTTPPAILNATGANQIDLVLRGNGSSESINNAIGGNNTLAHNSNETVLSPNSTDL